MLTILQEISSTKIARKARNGHLVQVKARTGNVAGFFHLTNGYFTKCATIDNFSAEVHQAEEKTKTLVVWSSPGHTPKAPAHHEDGYRLLDRKNKWYKELGSGRIWVGKVCMLYSGVLLRSTRG